MKPEIYRGARGWRWRVRARNGRIVGASSEAFTRRAACVRNLFLLAQALRP